MPSAARGSVASAGADSSPNFPSSSTFSLSSVTSTAVRLHGADFSNEIFDYRATYTPNLFATFITEAGMIGGLILAAMGFATWFEFMARFLGLKPKQ